MNKFRDLLIQYKVTSPLIRLGNKGDGGYVLPEILIDNTDVLYSYGVGSDVSFEVDFLHRKKIPIRLYDHSIDDLPYYSDLEYLNFSREGLGSGEEDNKNSFFEHQQFWGDGEKNTILKIDVEGAEYEYFEHDDFKHYGNVIGLIIELHDIGENKESAISLLEKINNNFSLVHIHGNNFGRLFLDHGDIFPDTLELVYICKKLQSDNSEKFFNKTPSVIDFPCNNSVLDFPNIIPASENQLPEILKIFNSLSDSYLRVLKDKQLEYSQTDSHIKYLVNKLDFATPLIDDLQDIISRLKDSLNN